MSIVITHKTVRSILSSSRVFPYAVNPYVGCGFGCSYCYARFIKRYTGHTEPWGEFVDIKTNAPELLRREIRRKPRARVWVSGVCDPYQWVERRYQLTLRCLEILVENHWPVTVQTKSPLVLRDIDLLKMAGDLTVCITVTTADETIRRAFEPSAPPIKDRLNALRVLHDEGIRTHAMIAPILPGAEGLFEGLTGIVDYVLIDRMNYHHADRIYKRKSLEWAMKDEYFRTTARTLKNKFLRAGIRCEVLF